MPADTALLADVYRDLHVHPELSFQEHRTAALVADRLTTLGYEVTTGVGRTGVVGVLRNGEGPTALLRADMDALPVLEKTGLPYASTVRGVDPDGLDVPVMHACGHDMHVTCLLGAADELAADRTAWSGNLVLVFQPAEELGGGAQGMVDDGLFERFPRPDVVLGQHVGPMPAGLIGLHAGPAFAAADALRITLHGRGGHGSRPEAAIDPVVMAAATVMRLQTVVSRDVAATDPAVVTVGAIRAGTKSNIIPDEAELLLSVRSFDEKVRASVLASIRRVVEAEAAASGATEPPEIVMNEGFPVLVNDPAASERTRAALAARFDPAFVVDPGTVTGSEDVGIFGTAAGVPTVYWILGGADHSHFAGADSVEQMATLVRDLPANHSPLFAPVIEPTISTGVAALVTAAQAWLPAG
ncbi:MAG TPA: amidohydrolase [Mycobacteriales bacterium]